MNKSSIILATLGLVVSGQVFAHGSDGLRKASQEVITFADVTTFARVPVPGVSEVVRTNKEFGASFNVTGVPAGHAFTMWVAAFNNPEKCATPCGCAGVDVPNPEVNTGMFMAPNSGRVSDAYGQADFDARIEYGVLPAGDGQVLIGVPAEKDAHLFLILRDHGPASSDPVVLQQQLTSWGGGCDVNTCQDTTLTIHPSPFCKVPRHH